jgi:23S rRNA pseudouridine2605 synthase
MKEYNKQSEEESLQPVVEMRLNKYIANAGISSRRGADLIIEEGRVTVNGKLVKELGVKVMSTDKVLVDNKLISAEEKKYVLVNKPRNVICTKSDEKGRRSIVDLLPPNLQHLYPVGRLDRNTTGIILLTNDGELTQSLLHPSKKVKKVYKAKVENQLTQEELDKMVTGIELEDGLCKFDKIVELREDESFRYGIEIHSGKNRVIRRMFDAIGSPIIKLDRVMFHTFDKKGIPISTHRELTGKELKNLGIYIRTTK